jgi:hypothetical protein
VDGEPKYSSSGVDSLQVYYIKNVIQSLNPFNFVNPIVGWASKRFFLVLVIILQLVEFATPGVKCAGILFRGSGSTRKLKRCVQNCSCVSVRVRKTKRW